MDILAENVRSQMRKGVLEYCILCILAKHIRKVLSIRYLTTQPSSL